jgi:hypothetical protein
MPAPNVLGDLQKTKQVIPKCDRVSLSHPWDKPAKPPGQTDPPCKKKKKNPNK